VVCGVPLDRRLDLAIAVWKYVALHVSSSRHSRLGRLDRLRGDGDRRWILDAGWDRIERATPVLVKESYNGAEREVTSFPEASASPGIGRVQIVPGAGPSSLVSHCQATDRESGAGRCVFVVGLISLQFPSFYPDFVECFLDIYLSVMFVYFSPRGGVPLLALPVLRLGEDQGQRNDGVEAAQIPR